MDPIDVDEIAEVNYLDDASATVEAPKEEQAAAGTELMDSEIWPWLASLLLAAVVIEGLVANRTAA